MAEIATTASKKSTDASSSAAPLRKRKTASELSHPSSASKSKKLSKATQLSSQGTTAQDTTETFRVEHLSYKRLLPGPTVVLVQVVEILPLELIVSLPNQLMGHVPITNISKTFTKRLEEEVEKTDSDAASEQESEDADDAEGDAVSDKKTNQLPSLDEMFTVGQYLRASVVDVYTSHTTSATSQSMQGRNGKHRGNEVWRSSRRAELSLEPERVNANASISDLKDGQMVLQAEIKSVEDNGYVLDFGVGRDLTAFVGFKEERKALKVAGNSWPKQRMAPGGIILARVMKIAENGRTCNVLISMSETDHTVVRRLTSLIMVT